MFFFAVSTAKVIIRAVGAMVRARITFRLVLSVPIYNGRTLCVRPSSRFIRNPAARARTSGGGLVALTSIVCFFISAPCAGLWAQHNNYLENTDKTIKKRKFFN